MPVFSEAVEVEGLAAANLLLPELSAAALMAAVSRQGGWKDGRKLASRALAQGSAPLAEMSFEEIAQNALLNRENLLRTLEDLTAVIRQMKGVLQADDPEQLEKLLAEGQQVRSAWLAGRMPPETPARKKSSGDTREKQALERFLKLER
jgi:prephenate dehydrogenase